MSVKSDFFKTFLYDLDRVKSLLSSYSKSSELLTEV